MKTNMRKIGIEKDIVLFLEDARRTLASHFLKELKKLNLAKDEKLTKYFNEIFESLIETYKPDELKKIDINRSINNMVEYVGEKQYDVNALVKIGTDLRYIVVKSLFLSNYNKDKQYQIWVAIINRFDWLQTQMIEYSFALYRKDLRETEAKFHTMVEKIQEGLLMVESTMRNSKSQMNILGNMVKKKLMVVLLKLTLPTKKMEKDA